MNKNMVSDFADDPDHLKAVLEEYGVADDCIHYMGDYGTGGSVYCRESWEGMQELLQEINFPKGTLFVSDCGAAYEKGGVNVFEEAGHKNLQLVPEYHGAQSINDNSHHRDAKATFRKSGDHRAEPVRQPNAVP